MLTEQLHHPESEGAPQVGIGDRLHTLGMQGRDARLDRRGADLRQGLSAPPFILARRRHEHHVVVRRPEGELGQWKADPPLVGDELLDVLRLVVPVGRPGAQVTDPDRLVADIKPVACLAENRTIFAGSVQDCAQLMAILWLHRQLHRNQMRGRSGGGNLDLGIVQGDRLTQTALDLHDEPRPLRRGHAVAQRHRHRAALLRAIHQAVGLDRFEEHRVRQRLEPDGLDLQPLPAADQAHPEIAVGRRDMQGPRQADGLAARAELTRSESGGEAERARRAMGIPHAEIKFLVRLRGPVGPQAQNHAPPAFGEVRLEPVGLQTQSPVEFRHLPAIPKIDQVGGLRLPC